jgi:hypothetical protein
MFNAPAVPRDTPRQRAGAGSNAANERENRDRSVARSRRVRPLGADMRKAFHIVNGKTRLLQIFSYPPAKAVLGVGDPQPLG